MLIHIFTQAPVCEWTASGVPLTALLELDGVSSSSSSSSSYSSQQQQQQQALLLSPMHSPLPPQSQQQQHHHQQQHQHQSSSITAFIAKAKVDIRGPAYTSYLHERDGCRTLDLYENPGPIQFASSGCPAALSGTVPRTLQLESYEYLKDIMRLKGQLDLVHAACRPGCDASLLRIAIKTLDAVTGTIELVQGVQSGGGGGK